MAKSLLDYIAEEDREDYLAIIERAAENKKNAPRAPRKEDPAKKLAKLTDKKAKLEQMIAEAKAKMESGEVSTMEEAIDQL